MKLNKSLDSIAFGGKTYREIFIGGQLYNLNNVSYTSPNPIFLGNGVWEIQGNNSFDNGQLRLIMSDTSKYLDGTYYFRVNTKNTSNTNVVLSRGFDIFSLNAWITNFLTTNANSVNSFSQNFNYVRANTTPSDRNRILLTTNAQTNNIQISPYFINLTALFGAGNEPTKAQMDTLFAEFQEAGSVAVGQFEQGQGKNLFDKGVNFIESGSLDTVGIDLVSTIRARTNGFIEVNQNTQYIGSVNNIYIVRAIYYYDVSFNFISLFVNDDASFTTPANTKYIRVLFRQITPLNDTIDSNDIEIISNTFQLELGSVSTAYEPYKYLAIHNPASNDIPIPALNNKTLNEVFVGGQLIVNGTFDNNINNWFTLTGRTLSHQTNFIRSTRVSNTPYIAQFRVSTFGNNNSKYYITFKAKSNKNGSLAVALATGTVDDVLFPYDNQVVNINTSFNNYSILANITTTSGDINAIRFNFTDGTLTNDFLDLDDVSTINLTSLGIASQTQAQMDAYFQAWQRNNAGTLLANTFIQHDQNSVPIADLNGKTLDEVFIGGQLDSLSDFTVNSAGADITFNDGVLDMDYTSDATFLDSTSLITGNSYYFTIKTNVISLTTNAPRVLFDNVDISGGFGYTIVGEYDFSTVKTINSTNNFLRLSRTSSTPSIFRVQYKDMYIINLTALGITATKEQLDFWYSVWQQNHKLGMRVHRASGNDIPLAVLNNQSLNQVFVGGQLITNSSLTTTSNWTVLNSTNSVLNNELINTGDGTSTTPLTFATISGGTTSINPNVVVYGRATLRVNNSNATSISVRSGNGQYGVIQNTPLINQPYNLSFRGLSTVATSAFVVRHFYDTTTLANGSKIFIKEPLLIDLTALNLTSLTKSQLDYLFTVWQFNTLNALVARQFIQEA
jgi:hypothetical protein